MRGTVSWRAVHRLSELKVETEGFSQLDANLKGSLEGSTVEVVKLTEKYNGLHLRSMEAILGQFCIKSVSGRTSDLQKHLCSEKKNSARTHLPQQFLGHL